MIVRIATLTLLVCLHSAEALAWGATAHRIVATAVEDSLPSDVAKEVKRLLGGKHLSEVANDPDGWAARKPETRAWHFVDIPLSAKGYDAYDVKRDCASSDCLVEAIKRFEAVLGDRKESDSRRVEALIYLVH